MCHLLVMVFWRTQLFERAADVLRVGLLERAIRPRRV